MNHNYSEETESDSSEKKAVLHVCCAPCSTHCIDELRESGIEPTLYLTIFTPPLGAIGCKES